MSTVHDGTVATPALKYWRLHRALTQAELAHLAGTSESTIVRLERGGRTHAALARALTDALVEDMAAWMRELERDELVTDEGVDVTQSLTADQRAALARATASV